MMQGKNTFINRMRKNQRGAALAEFVIVAPVLLMILIAVFYFQKAQNIKHRTIFAARCSAWASSKNPYSLPTERIRQIYFPNETSQIVDLNSQEYANDFFDRFQGLFWTSIFPPLGVFQATGKKIEVTCALEGIGPFPEFNISSSHVVGENPWSVKEVFEAIWESFYHHFIG